MVYQQSLGHIGDIFIWLTILLSPFPLPDKMVKVAYGKQALCNQGYPITRRHIKVVLFGMLFIYERKEGWCAKSSGLKELTYLCATSVTCSPSNEKKIGDQTCCRHSDKYSAFVNAGIENNIFATHSLFPNSVWNVMLELGCSAQVVAVQFFSPHLEPRLSFA